MEPMFTDKSGQNDNSIINADKFYYWLQQYWISIAVAVVLAFIGAFVYMRYTTPRYKVLAKVLIKSEQKGTRGTLFEEIGVGGNSNNIENEVEIFKSRLLMTRVVQDLHLNLQYYVPGKIVTTSLYNDAPFRVAPLFEDSSISSSSTYELKIVNKNSFEIFAGKKKITGNLGDTITLPIGRVVIEKNLSAGHMYDGTEKFVVVIEALETIVDRCIGALTVELLNKQVSIINLSYEDVLPQRGEDIINKLIQVYTETNIYDKTQVAEGTLEFIKTRLADVGIELTGVEKEFEGFKRNNKIIDVETQTKILQNNTNENSKELTEKEVQLRVLESLDKYLKDNNNVRRVMPATLIAQDMTLTNVMTEYNTLQAQRQKMLLSYTENSPYIAALDNQLKDLRSAMQNYIVSLKHGYEVSVNELKMREGAIDNRLSQVPEKERIFLEYARQQQIKQELYLFLLKKREETAISKSATVSNLKVVDPAKRISAPVSPVKAKVYLMALIIGLIIPGIRVAAKELLNNKVRSKSEIERNTLIPILGEIIHHTDDNIVVVKKDSKTIVSEQFRALRTNLQFLMEGDGKKVIMLTSSMSGEGKSFISINLASALSLSEKKVVLLELDLRKPKIAQHLNLKDEEGFSNYIVGNLSLDNIIAPSGISNNLFVICSGPIPPSPAELLMLPKLQQFFDELKSRFDYIIIDSAPIGLVTDAQLLNKYTDTVLYVVRQQYTYKQQVKAADGLYRSQKLSNMNLVINDTKLNQTGSYGGYNSGYFEDEASKFSSFFQKIIKRK